MILAVPARAKLNLDLTVTGRRPDGFHDLRTTFQAIDLHDLIEIQPAAQTSFDADGFTVDKEDNSLLRAHRAVEEAAKTTLPVKITLHKRIPPGSGMGGASSDAAATLKALQAMFKLEIDITNIARQLGADVPFFLIGGMATAEGRGDRLTPQKPQTTPQWFAIAWPRIELATKDVYEKWDELKGEPPNELRRAAQHVDPRIEDFATELGAGWQMTGSGSAFFKPTSTKREAQQAIAKRPDAWTAVASSVPRWA